MNNKIKGKLQVAEKVHTLTPIPRKSVKGRKSQKKNLRKLPKNIDKEVLTPQPRSQDTKCFKCFGRGHIDFRCPNRRTIFLRGKDVYSSQSDEASGEEEKENSEGAYPCEGELMMIRRTLNNQPSMKQETQRENIFHTRCKVFENVCSLIVNSGSCCNCCSARMVEKLINK